MPKLPKKLKINHVTFDIVEVPSLTDDHQEALWGQHRPAEGKIKLRKELPDDLKAGVLLHEILHGLVDMYHVSFVDRESEERLVDTFSHGLICLFQDNPKFIDYIKEVIER